MDFQRVDEQQAVGFMDIGSELCQELVVRQSHGSGQSGLRFYPFLDLLADFQLAAEQLQAAGHVQKGFIQGKPFYQRGKVVENGEYFGGFFPVPCHPGADKMPLRAKSSRTTHRQSRVNAESSRFVTGGGHHAARAQAADDDREPFQGRVVQALNRSVKRVHVHVDDCALCGLRHGSPFVRQWRFARQLLRPHYMPMTDSATPDNAPAPPLDQFPILESGLYFNHAAVGPWPRRTAEAVQNFAEENMNRGSAAYREWFARENDLRKSLAQLSGASHADDIALVKNTTEGICTVAFGMDWRAGDNIVLPGGEFPSNRLPWLAQAASGVELREIDIRSAPHAETALLDAMDHKTRLLTVSAVAWDDGFRLDLVALGEACRKRNVLFFVDAIQQLGALPLDVDACRIDFLAADAHKWLLAPEGIAVFYSREEARGQLNLLQQGWHMFDQPWHFEREDWTPSASARRFEAGSPNTMGQAALHASAGLLLDYGMENVGQRILANTDQLLRGLAELPGIFIISATEQKRRSGIITFAHERSPAQELHRHLVQAGVSCVIRGGGIRLSPHFYQGERQIEAFMAILRDILAQTG